MKSSGTNLIDHLIKKSKVHGYLLRQDIVKVLPKANLPISKISLILSHLMKRGVQVFRSKESAGLFSEAKKVSLTEARVKKRNSYDFQDDASQSYWKNMTGHELLSREQEIDLAIQIRTAQTALTSILLVNPLFIRTLHTWADDLLNDRIVVGDLVQKNLDIEELEYKEEDLQIMEEKYYKSSTEAKTQQADIVAMIETKADEVITIVVQASLPMVWDFKWRTLVSSWIPELEIREAMPQFPIKTELMDVPQDMQDEYMSPMDTDIEILEEKLRDMRDEAELELEDALQEVSDDTSSSKMPGERLHHVSVTVRQIDKSLESDLLPSKAMRKMQRDQKTKTFIVKTVQAIIEYHKLYIDSLDLAERISHMKHMCNLLVSLKLNQETINESMERILNIHKKIIKQEEQCLLLLPQQESQAVFLPLCRLREQETRFEREPRLFAIKELMDFFVIDFKLEARRLIEEVYELYQVCELRMEDLSLMVVLLNRYKKISFSAKIRLIECNLRLVCSIVQKYVSYRMTQEDLINEGNMGLAKSVDKYDPRTGYKFATYATWWIRQSITRAKADQARVIRLPVHTTEGINKVNRVRLQFIHDHQREPSLQELAHSSGMSPEKVQKTLLHSASDTISLDEPIGEDDDSSTLENITSGEDGRKQREQYFAQKSASRVLTVQLSKLAPKEEYTLRARYNAKSETLEGIGSEKGITRERVRQIEVAAKAKMSKLLEEQDARTLMVTNEQ